MSVTAKKWVFSKYFEGDVKLENFKLVEEKLDKNIKPGEILVEAEFLSVDPYMRVTPIIKRFMEERKSDVIVGTQVAKVLVSRAASFPVGSYVIGELGWRTHTVCNESQVQALPEIGNLPTSTALGVIGMPGATAYIGIHDILDPKPGEVVVVSAAAGAVGSLVGQMAKIKGSIVIGSASSQDKLDWLTNDLGFDHAFNYKTMKLEDALKKYAPDGVDCFFDNVGGEFTTTMIRHMKADGRIALCGSISTYRDEENQPKGPYPWYHIQLKKLQIKGLVSWAEMKKWPAAFKQILQWIQEGKLKYREHVTQGFKNMPSALLELFESKNIGKAIVEI